MRTFTAAGLVATLVLLGGIFASLAHADPALGARAKTTTISSAAVAPLDFESLLAAPPTNPSWSADISRPRINQTITFTGFASDPDNDIATYAWNWGDGNSTAPSASDQATHSYATAGTYTVRLTVTDVTALSAAYENTITVRNNWAPESVYGYPDSNADAYPRVGTAATFDFYGDDPEDFNGDLTWDVDWGDGTVHGTTTTAAGFAQLPHTWSAPGTYVIHYSATDSDGIGGANPNKTSFGPPIVVTVAANPAPQNVSWGTDVGQAATNETVTFTGYAQDPDGGAVANYEWDFNGDGVYEAQSSDGAGTGNPGTSQITHQFAQPGTYAVGLRVTDDDLPAGAGTTYIYTFVVTNPANGPYGYLYADVGNGYYGYNAKVNQPIAFNAGEYDPNGVVQATHYVFHWGDGTADTSTASPDTVHSYTSPGDYRPSVAITLSNAQVITVQYTAYTFDNNMDPYGSYTYGVLHVVDNARPVYAYAYETNYTGCLHPNTSINFTLYGYDPDGGHIATFDVDWNADGTFESTGIAAIDDTANVNHTFTTDGTYQVVVRAHDDDTPTKTLTDYYDTQTVEITPDNCQPIGYATHTPDSPQTNHTITFDASYSYDLDGTTQNYQWDWNQDGTYDSTGVSATHAYATDGTHYYTLKVTDNQGGVGYTTQSVETHTGNHDPFFYALYISDFAPDTAETVFFDASGYDDDGTITQYKWDWNGDGIDDQTTSSPSVSHVYASAGTYHPRVTLVDDDGGSASSFPDNTYTVTVTAAVPSAIIDWSPDEPHPANTIAFTAFASSPNGAINQYTWHWGDGTADTVTTIPNANHAYANAGTFPVSVTVRDTTNATGTGPAQDVKVMTNWPPHAFFTASPQCTTTSTSITFDGTGTTDSDSAIASYHWDFDDGTTTDTNGPTTTHTFANTGTYDVTLVAKDASNATSTPYHRDITVQGGDCPPQDVYFTYSPTSLPSGSPIAFTGHAVDPDGTVSSYTWSWGDGTSDTISPTSAGSTTNHTFANPGLYTVQVIARDNLGLAGQPYSLQLVVGVDITPPTVTLTMPADGAFTTAVPTYSGTAGNDANDSASVTVKIYSGSTVSGSPVQTRVATRSGTTWTINGSPALSAGTYTAQAQQSDAANHIGFSGPHTFTVDPTPPTITLTTPANGGSTNDTTPTLGGVAGIAAGDLAGVTVTVYNGPNVLGTVAATLPATRNAQTGAYSVDATTLPEGTYTAVATQPDAAGNTGTSSANTFVVDTTAPVVTLTNPATALSTNDPTPTYNGAATAGTGDSTTVVVKIYSGNTATGSPVQTLNAPRSGTNWTIDGTVPLAEGTYTAQSSQSDAAGNTGTSAAHTFVVDTTAPVMTLTAPSDATRTNDTTPTYNGAAGNATGDSASVTVNIYAGSVATGSPVQTRVATRSGGTWTIDGSPALAAGTYTAQATQVDSAGNTGTSAPHTFAIDLTAPTVTLTAPANNATLTSGTPAFSGVGGIATGDSSSVTVNVYAGSAATGQPVESLIATRNAGTGSYSVNASPALTDGTYTAQAVQTDSAGNSGTSSANTFTINGPPIVTLTAPTGGSVLGDSTPALSGDRGTAAGDLPTVTVRIYSGNTVGGSPVQTLTDAGAGATWQVTAAVLADGTYTAQASQDDASSTGTSAAVTFRIDTTAPTVTITTPANGARTSDTTPTISGTGGTATGDATTVNVKIYTGATASGSPIQTASPSVSGVGTWTFEAAALAEGTYTAQVTQSDNATPANTGTSTTVTWTVDTTPPTVVLLTPLDGAALVTHTPSITGTGSTGATDLTSVSVRIYGGATATGSPIQTLTPTLSSGAFSSTPASLADGTYTVQATQGDQAGNVATSAARTFRVDTTAPILTITSPTNGSSSTATTPRFAGTAGAATGDSTTVTVHVYSGPSASGSALQTLTATRSGTAWSVLASAALAVGTYTAQAAQSDSLGHTGTSAASTFTIVAPPPANHAPTCTGMTKSVLNATPTAITLACTDADGDPLTLSIVAPPGHGMLGTIASASVTYTPVGTYSGSDTFTFKASDGKAASNVAAVSITVLPRITPPAMKCKVPNVVGKSLVAAKAAIKKAHCRTGNVSYARARKVKKGNVISQSRHAGHLYRANTAINLVVSRGKKR